MNHGFKHGLASFLKTLLSKKRVSPLIMFIILTAVSHHTYAATFESGVTRDNVPYVKLSGEISTGDAQQFRYILDQWAANKAPVQILDLNSNGGGVIEAYLFLQLVINYKISTIVMPGSHCISACVSVFAAGKARYADPLSIVGVHRVSEAGEDTVMARSASIDMINAYRVLDIPPNIRLNMIETDPSMVYYLTPADKHAFNTVTQDTAKAIVAVQQSSLKTQEKIVSQGDRNLARSLNTQGIGHIKNKQYIQAISVLEQSKNITPTDAEVLGNLGYAYYMVGDLDSAQNTLTSSLRLMPNRGATWNNLGLVLSARGDISWATESFVKYWNYSRNKKAATNQFFYWESVRPGTALEQASRMARAQLGITTPVN